MLLNTDCEGPTVENDNAAEIATEFLSEGLFRRLSLLDDYTAYVRQKEAYNAGDTLRLLLPFLKAAGVTESDIDEATKAEGIRFIRGAEDGIAYALDNSVNVFEISASYRPFALEVGKTLRIPPTNVYCTELALDRYQMLLSEREDVEAIGREIMALDEPPEINLPRRSGDRGSVAQPSEELFETLYELIWNRMASRLPCSSRMLNEVRVMGGRQKAWAIYDTVRVTREPWDAVIYVGDSITDVEAFHEIDALGGVGISFNGNRYAVQTAKVSAWSLDSSLNALLVAIMTHFGKEGLYRFADEASEPEPWLKTEEMRGLYERVRSAGRWGVMIHNNDPAKEQIAITESAFCRKETRKQAAKHT